MVLQIPISEAVDLVKARYGKLLSLRVVTNNTIAVGYEVKVGVPLLGEITKDIEINLEIEKIEDEVLVVQCGSGGWGIELILKGILAALPSIFSSSIIEIVGERQLNVHLCKIKQLQKVLEKVTIKGISFENDCALVNLNMK